MTDYEQILFMRAIQEVYDAIQNKESVLVHCSAGLHRTGMFAYALLRKGYMSHENSLKLIAEMRQETFDALESKYIVFADRLLRTAINIKQSNS